MERLLTENTTTGKYELLQSTNGALNTTSSGSGSSSTVIQARTDIADQNTETFIKCSSTGLLNVSDEKITQGEGDIAGGGNGLQQVLCYGKDQSGNLDPINVDNNGHLKITLNDIEPNITSAIKTEIFGLDGSTQRQITVDSTGALIVRTDNSNDSIRIVGQNTAGGNKGIAVEDNDGAILCGAKVLVADPTHSDLTRQVLRLNTKGKLLVDSSSSITRGTITFPTPFGSGGVSSSIDVGDKPTLNFHIEGMTNTHTGFILQGSNNNSTFYSLQLFTPQTVGITDFIGGAITRGFRYYRIENAGASVSVTASPYNSYNN